MTPKVFLRVAAVALTVFEFGHTVGGMILAKSHGPGEDTVLSVLAAYRFDTMGSMRSHYDFYRGEGWFLSATLATMITLCWLLSNSVGESPALVRRISLVIALLFAVNAALCVAFFFVAPLAMSSIASVACFAAYWRLRSA